MIRLREALDAKNMSTTDLSWETRIPVRTIARWAAGETEPKLSKAHLIAKALGTTTDYLAGVGPDKPVSAPDLPGAVGPPPPSPQDRGRGRNGRRGGSPS